MAPKVFKIPDGMGGVTYQVQTPDGEWHLTDQNGNFLTEDSPKEETPDVSIPKARRQRRKSQKKNDSPFVNFSLQIPKEDYQTISDYVLWTCIFKEPVSRAAFMLRTALEAVRKDREYREFQKRNSMEG